MDTEVEKKRSRNFCFTDYVLEDKFWVDFNAKYDCYVNYGREICPTTGKEHFQGYLHFKNAHTFETIRKLLKPRHVKICKGSIQQNLVYTSKDGIVTELGRRPNQGKRTDLIKIKDEIVNGTKVSDIAIDNPMMYHQYGRTLNYIEDLTNRKKYRTEMTKGVWYFGKTGVGKSHRAFEGFTPETHYRVKLNDRGWWDGYNQQETVILNEFRGQIAYSELLELVDRWPYDVPRRGKEPMPFTSKKVIVTSSLEPAEVYKNLSKHDKLEQLYRRFDVYEVIDQNTVKLLNTEVLGGNTSPSLQNSLMEDD